VDLTPWIVTPWIDTDTPYLKAGQKNINLDMTKLDSARRDALDLMLTRALIDLKIVKIIPQPCENFPEVIPHLTFFSSKNEESISQYGFKQPIPLTDDGIVCTQSSSVYAK
jgi:hypothetical protein